MKRIGKEKKSYIRVIKNVVPESKDMNLVQEWEISRVDVICKPGNNDTVPECPKWYLENEE